MIKSARFCCFHIKMSSEPALQIDTNVNQTNVEIQLLPVVVENETEQPKEVTAAALEQVKEPVSELSADAEQLLTLVLTKSSIKTASNAYEIVVEVMQVAEALKAQKKTSSDKLILVLSVIEHIAKGADGISGTSDDLIKPEILHQIRMLLDNKLVASFINTAVSLAKGNFHVDASCNCCTIC